VDGSTRLRINLLGQLTASFDGAPLDLGGPRQRAVLAVLLLAKGDIVPADRVADSVWSGRAPVDTAGALQAYVSHLRRRLEPGSAARTRSGVIVSEGPGYAVRLPRDAVDAWQFEQLLQQAAADTDPARIAAVLDEALALWRGPALADYADEPWAEAEIGRLAELRTVARERLLAARLELGEAAMLVPDLEAMVADEPLREERWRLLALALYRAHRQADALAALRRARTTLADELGVDPGPALRELESQVLEQSPVLHVPRPRAPASAPAAPGPRRVRDDLMDRDRELDAVRTALDDLLDDRPRLLLVEGPAGIGKTRLLTEARRLAGQRSVRVLTARGSQLEKAFGFGVVRQLFEPELADAGRRQELLGGAAAGARGVFDLASAEAAEGSFAVLHGLYWLAVNLTADGPVLLAIDDVQWCDSASLRWLAYLVRRLEGLPVLVVGTVRTGEQHEDDELLAELQLDPATTVLRPEPLSPEATAGIVALRLGEPVSPLFAHACHRTTAGNPLLLRQLLRALESDGVRPDAAHADSVVAVGSRAVSSMVLVRLRRLGDRITSVARAAAVLGDGALLPAVAVLAELPERDTAAALAALARAEVVKDEQPLAFVHPLVREAVYRDLPAAERELGHERAAAVLRAAGASDEQVAAHLLLAPPRGDDATVAALRSAARTAAVRGASDSATTYLRRALAEPPTGTVRRDVLVELGMVESLLDGATGPRHLLQAYGLHEDPRIRADLAIAIARTHVFASPPGIATAFAREARLVLPEDLIDQRQALLALERIGGYMHGLDPAVWRTADPPEPADEGLGAQMLAATLAWEATVDGADRERALRLARFAHDGDRLMAVDHGLLWVVAANVRMLADDDLGDFWLRARAEAHRRGSLFAALSVSVWEGFWRWRRGELHEALACLALGLEQDRMWNGTGIGESYTRAFEIGCHLDRGDLPTARRVADAALTGPALGEGGRLVKEAVASLLVAERRFDEALTTLEGATTPVPIANPAWNPWRRIRAGALHGLGRTDEAVQLVEEELALLRRWGAPSYLGSALRLLGWLRGPAGLDDLREAVDVLTPTTAGVELARAQVTLGAARGVPDDEAVPLLQAAAASAHRLGAQAVEQRASAALRARGRPADVPDDGGRPLSSTEQRVLDLAGTGLGVREVAQRLFMTPGTVQAVLERCGGRLKSVSSPTGQARVPVRGMP
jgi:DNA-binding SARP family transcriptional activator/tetratricopeptide (TPR) repeat protein